MKKNKLFLTGAAALLSCGMLTSCDYSNFSLFGFFYNIYENNLEEQYKKPGSNISSSNSGSESSSTSITVSDDAAPQTYLTKSTTTDNGTTVEKYDLLVLLDSSKAALNSYVRYVPASGEAYTHSSFATVTDYTRTDNVVTLSFGTMVYTDRTNTTNIQYYYGDSTDSCKAAFKAAFDTEEASFVVSTDGTFTLGKTSTGEKATGLSTANTYWYYEESARPSYYMLTLLDNNDYYLNTFCMDSKNITKPVSAFVTFGTYKSYPDYSTSEYDAVRVNRGRGHMYASNNGSNMEFDISDDDNFDQWLGMSVGNCPAYKVTKVGFTGLLGDVKKYGFEAFASDIDTDSTEPEVVDPTEGAMLVVEGQKNSAIKLAFFNDGTYHFVWSANNIDETGTWTYSEENDAVALSAEKSDKTAQVNTITKQEDGSYKVDYVAACSEQLTQSFIISEKDFTSCFKAYTVLELTGDKNDAITLTFKSDNTYTFAFTTYKTSEDGTWSYDAATNTLSMKVGDKECATVTKNGVYDIHYTYSQSSQLDQHFSLTKAEWGKTFVHSITTLTGDKNSAITLDIKSDNTYTFAFTTYNTSEEGKWSYDAGTDTLSMKVGDKECLTVTKTDNTYDLYYVYSQSSQLDQHYTLDANTFKELFSGSDLVIKGTVSDKILLTLNRDHSYTFAFTTYNVSETGSWSYDSTNDQVVLSCKDTTNYLTKQEDGSYKGTYVSDKSAQLTQEFVLAAADTGVLGTTLVNADKTNTSGTHFGLIFNSNHTYSFHFYNYNVEETGTWSYDSTTDTFSFFCYNTENTSTKNEDGTYTINYVSHRSSQMTQEFTLTAENSAKIKA
jgi:hypothetical protein